MAAKHDRTYGPTKNPDASEFWGILARRTEVDDEYLLKNVGRIVFKYFSGYGNFLGKVVRKVPERPVVEVEYEDGDGEELYLDQLFDALVPLDTLPVDKSRNTDANDKYGYVWPPPTGSTRLMMNAERKRKPSAHALKQEELAQQRKEAAEADKRRKVKAREDRERKKAEKVVADAKRLSHQRERIALREVKDRERRALEEKRLEKKRQAELKAAALREKQAAEAAAQAAKATKAAKAAKLKKSGKRPASELTAVSESVGFGGEVDRSGPADATALTTKHITGPLASRAAVVKAGNPESKKKAKRAKKAKRRGKDQERLWVKCSVCTRKHWSDCGCPFCHPDLEDTGPALPEEAPPTDNAGCELQGGNSSKRWSGNSTAALLVSLREQVQVDDSTPTQRHLHQSQDQPTDHQETDEKEDEMAEIVPTPQPSAADAQDPLSLLLEVAEIQSKTVQNHGNEAAGPEVGAPTNEIASGSRALVNAAAADEESRDISEIYSIIKNKVDITCGGDGYGMTGNVTMGSLQRLFNTLRDRFELNETSWFIDLGHGMGRPTMHAAALEPKIAGSFGTEFNPQLYKQSMLALVECAQAIPMLKESPRVFFMDQNIKDMTSLEPFTHVYTFQIGMPEDVVEHMLQLISQTRSVKYAIIYPHRAVTTKRLNEIGEVVYSQSMSMPGGMSYAVNVVRVAHPAATEPSLAQPQFAQPDTDVNNALEILRDKLLYANYLEQLGLVSMLEDEQVRIMSSRSSRRNVANTAYLSQSPCLPDINFGFLRRIAIALGVSTVGDKVQILSNIQQYCPVTFGLAMFAVGDDYNDGYIDKVIARLLAVAPSRRQPESTHN